MDDNECNKIIAEFMGEEYCQCSIFSICPSPSAHHEYCINSECQKIITPDSYIKYTESLDALKQPILKMGNAVETDVIWYSSMWCGIMKNAKQLLFENPSLTLEQAAAHATAKAILEHKK